MAYDQIAHTNTEFDLPDQLNCKLRDLRRELGGCGGNIVYNLAKLGLAPQLLSCHGGLDATPYLSHLTQLGVDAAGCLAFADSSMASAIIMTDTAGTQFTGFYPGPIPTPSQWSAHLRKHANRTTPLFIQAPFPAELMLCGLSHFKSSTDALTVWAPGQYADQLGEGAIKDLLALADWVVGNKYEIQCLERHVGLHNQNMIMTAGSAPIRIQTQLATEHCKVQEVPEPVDPTGCGDAFLAGFCAHLARSAETQTDNHPDLHREGIQLGSTLAARCLLQHGSQHHACNDLAATFNKTEN